MNLVMLVVGIALGATTVIGIGLLDLDRRASLALFVISAACLLAELRHVRFPS